MKLPAWLFANILFFAGMAGGPAFAAQQTVTLSVPGMTCSACPITVRKALEKVPGVGKVKVTYEPKEAVVTYDDSKTNPEALTEATAWAGYPSTVRKKP